MKVPYFVPWLTEDDRKSIEKVFKQRWLTNGPILKKFEEKFQKFIETKYSLGVTSGTHALHLAVRSLELKSTDEVIVPTLTFAATANAVLYCGAKPILTDIDYESMNISSKEIEKRITKKTKAIIVVHYGGQPCDMDQIIQLSKKHNLKIIEDCAHALGSTYKSKKCGSIGDLGCFSFFPTKIITTGEGGMISTNNQKFSEKIKLLKSQGMSVSANERETKAQWKYDIVELGYNYRLDEFRSALGLSQFNRVNIINQLRIKIAKKYDAYLEKVNGIIIPKKYDDRKNIYHLYTIKITKEFPINRDELFQKLFSKGVGASVQYYPLHLMTYYRKKLKIKSNCFPNANKLKDQIISLPIFPTMTINELNYVTSIISNLAKK